jgi:hypothetical protein
MTSDGYSEWVQSYLDYLIAKVGPGSTLTDREVTLIHGNIRGFAQWAREHPFAPDRPDPALLALSDAATPGPWVPLTHGTASQRDAAMRAALSVMAVRAPDSSDIEYTDLSWVESADPAGPHIALVGNGPNGPENSKFIAAAVNYVRSLLADPAAPEPPHHAFVFPWGADPKQARCSTCFRLSGDPVHDAAAPEPAPNGLSDEAWRAVRSALQIAQQGPESPEERFVDALRTFGFTVLRAALSAAPEPETTP